VADFGVFVQIEGLVEGLMHVSETAVPRGGKPQEQYREGETIRVRILRIDEGEMKVGLSGLDDAGQPLSPAAPAQGEAAPAESAETSAPVEAVAPSAPPEDSPEATGAVEAAPGAVQAPQGAESEDPAAAPKKKKRTRKKTEDSPPKA
jgi:transcriptional accessory protein Tex/SPT6